MEAKIARRNKRAYSPGATTALVACLLACVSCSPHADADPGVEQVREQTAQPRLGLMSTLPIYWNEAVEFSDLLDDGRQMNWVRSALERDYALEPLDVLTPETLAPLKRPLNRRLETILRHRRFLIGSYLAFLHLLAYEYLFVVPSTA